MIKSLELAGGHYFSSEVGTVCVHGDSSRPGASGPPQKPHGKALANSRITRKVSPCGREVV